MTSGAHAPIFEPRPGDVVAVDIREAKFLYRRGPVAVVRFRGDRESRVVPFSKVRLLAA
jgi:hypothetical protein